VFTDNHANFVANEKGIQEFRDCVSEFDEHNDDNPYSRIEVYYPFKTFGVSLFCILAYKWSTYVDFITLRYISTTITSYYNMIIDSCSQIWNYLCFAPIDCESV